MGRRKRNVTISNKVCVYAHDNKKIAEYIAENKESYADREMLLIAYNEYADNTGARLVWIKPTPIELQTMGDVGRRKYSELCRSLIRMKSVDSD